MNKKGFTLQELLVTMAIIGIIAAATAPMIANIMPNENKMKHLKAYKTLATAADEILSDPSLYWDTYNDDGTVNSSGLASTGQPQIEPYSGDDHCQGNTKFPAIFANYVSTNEGPSYDDNKVEFTTIDGILWVFTGNDSVTINVRPSDNNASHNCVSGDENCTEPNKYKFTITNDGAVLPDDDLGELYLRNATDLRRGE